MRLAILGGTFNPVHKGHLSIAEAVRTRFGYQRILFIPANIPAHKAMEVDVGGAHRLKMVELAIAGYPHFLVDDCELRRGGTSYTIDTVREVNERYPIQGKPGLIIGDDLVEEFETWRDVGLLMEIVDLIVAQRQSRKKVQFDYPCRYVDNSLFPISSSRIRERLQSGREPAVEQSLRDWLPAEVLEYILRHDLYN